MSSSFSSSLLSSSSLPQSSWWFPRKHEHHRLAFFNVFTISLAVFFIKRCSNLEPTFFSCLSPYPTSLPWVHNTDSRGHTESRCPCCTRAAASPRTSAPPRAARQTSPGICATRWRRSQSRNAYEPGPQRKPMRGEEPLDWYFCSKVHSHVRNSQSRGELKCIRFKR